MHFASVEFLLSVVLSLIVFHLAPTLRGRRWVLATSNVIFVAVLASSPTSMLPVAVFLLAGFALVRLAQALRDTALTIASITALIAAFVYLKGYSLAAFLPPLSEPYSVIGLSYVLFRILHLIVDGSNGALRTPVPFLLFFNYCCSFLSWLSGPLQRYEEFVEQEQRLADIRLSSDQMWDAFARVVTGFFKLALLSPLLFDLHHLLASLPLAGANPLRFAAVVGGAASAYTLYMYYNFAGYMDVVIGLGALYGFRLPENFNRPFASESFLEFWSRWHITLSNWFKFYVFNPTVKALASRWGSRRSMPYLGVAAYFATFALMGIWHGSTPIFFLYGLFLGGGVSANKLYEIEGRRLLGKEAFGRLRSNAVYVALCRGTVFTYFTVALMCFWVPPALGRELAGSPLRVVASFLAATAVAAAILEAGVRARRGWDWASPSFRGAFETDLTRQIAIGCSAYAVLILILLKTTAVPTFVYVSF